MPQELGNPEKSALIALLLADGEVSTPELKKRHGVELRKETRETLNRAGLITSRTERSPHRHVITEAGMAKCEDVLASGERPPRASALLVVVLAVLGPVIGYLRRNGIRLAEVVQPAPLESLIRAAYRDLANKPQDWVRLAKLRPKLDGADRHEVDQALRAMTRTGFVHLAPDSNRKTLTDADRAAAVRIGSEDKHLVAIEES